MITPIEIQGKTFKSGGLGYDKKEVDAFLREVLKSYETIYRENMELNDKITVLNEGIQYYKTIEKTLQKALVLAEKTAEDTKIAAVEKAKQIEKEAQTRAQMIVADSKNELEHIHNQTIQLIQQYEKYKLQFKSLAAAQLELLDSDCYNINIARLDAFIDTEGCKPDRQNGRANGGQSDRSVQNDRANSGQSDRNGQNDRVNSGQSDRSGQNDRINGGQDYKANGSQNDRNGKQDYRANGRQNDRNNDRRNDRQNDKKSSKDWGRNNDSKTASDTARANEVKKFIDDDEDFETKFDHSFLETFDEAALTKENPKNTYKEAKEYRQSNNMDEHEKDQEDISFIDLDEEDN